MKKRLLTLLTVALILVTSTCLHAAKDGPDGFRNIKWGMHPHQIKGLQLHAETPTHNFYIKKSEKLTYDKARLQKITYAFHKKHGFTMALLQGKGQTTHARMQKILTKQYGRPRQTKDTQTWQGYRSKIVLTYDERKNQTTCTFLHDLMYR